jgi:hypothetical protein
MAWLYGKQIREAEEAELLRRLRERGTIEAVYAADTVKASGAHRNATSETSVQARSAILLELQEWTGLERTAPGLAALRDHLATPPTRAPSDAVHDQGT